MTVLARIGSTKNLLLKGSVYNKWQGVGDNQSIDEVYQIDNATSLDNASEADVFLNSLLSLTTEQVDVIDVKRLDTHGNLIVPNVASTITNIEEIQQLDTTYNVDDVYSLDDSAYMGLDDLFTSLFNLVSQEVMVDFFKFTSNTIYTPSILENQNL